MTAMPDRLSRDKLTPAARLIMAPFAVFLSIVGANYVFTPRATLTAASQALAYGDRLLPLPAWGAMFLFCAGFMVTAMLAHADWSSGLYSYALLVTAVCQAIWSVVFIFAAFDGGASPAAFAWPAFVGCVALSLDRSIRPR